MFKIAITYFSGDATMSKKVARITKSAINWKEFRDKVPLDQKGQFLAFKAKSDNYLRRFLSFPETPPKIDWETYKASVPVEGLVDKFKSEYEKLEIPYPPDTLSEKIEEQWCQIHEEIEKYVADCQKDIEAAKKELARINGLPDFEDMTMEMFYDLYPGHAQDFVKKPSFWPHTPDEQLDYKKENKGF